MITGVHARMIQIVEDRHLIQGLHILKVVGGRKISPFLGKKVRLVESKTAADEDEIKQTLINYLFLGGIIGCEKLSDFDIF